MAGTDDKWTSGSDKCWVAGQYILRLHKRGLRLLDMYKELRSLKLPTAYVVFDMLVTIRKLSDGIDKGRYKFKDAEDILTQLEDFIDNVDVRRLIDKLRGLGEEIDDGMVQFLLRTGFLEDDVTMAVTKQMLNKSLVHNKGDRSDSTGRRARRVLGRS